MQDIAILLATYNGEKYLSEFLESLLNQTKQNFSCYIHDDGSEDRTFEIINTYHEKFPNKFIVLDGPSTGGASNNFMYIASKVNEQYIMFADQDDIWMPDKVEKTYAAMKKNENNGEPLAVHTDLCVVDSQLNMLSPSYYNFENRDPRANAFNQLLSKNTAAGCTMMINRSLLILGLQHSSLMKKTLHDWGYMLLARLYGEIIYIDVSTIFYRQHEDNSVGAKNKKSFEYKIKQCKDLFKGQKVRYIKNSIKLEKELVRDIYTFIEKDNKYYEYISMYQEIQKKGKLKRMAYYYKNGNVSRSCFKVWRVLFV